MRRGSRRLGVAALALVAFGPATAARAYETDQYSNRLLPLKDSLAPLNAMVNRAIEHIVATWQGKRDDQRLARAIYWKLGGLYWVDHIERWAMKSPEIEKLPQHGHQSIYAGAPFYATRVGFFFGIGPTIKVAGSRLGTDKLGHFFSQGVKYYGSHMAGETEDQVLDRGRFNERWLFGQWTTSVYSNADLVANYEGYRFYLSLFADGIVPGKPAIVKWQGDLPRMQRPFDWADHVNDDWDEALNPSFVERALQRWFDHQLPELCDEYRRSPAAYVPTNEQALAERYRGLGMKAAPQNRIDHVCGRPTPP